MSEEKLFKICTKCGESKEATIDNFRKDAKGKYGLRSVCKECEKKYREDNRDMITQRNKEYYDNNADKIRAQKREYYNKHKEEINARRRELNATMKCENCGATVKVRSNFCHACGKQLDKE